MTESRTLSYSTRLGDMFIELGQRLGCRGDSPPAPEEHLMIVLHDLLVWDEHVTPTHSHTQRRRKLQDLVTPIRGLVAIGYRTWLDLAAKGSVSRLACEIAYALSQR